MKTAATVAIAIASIMIGEARAADMAVPGGTPVVAPPVTYGNYAPTTYGNYNWTGIYAGANGGYAWNEDTFVLPNGLSAGHLSGPIAGGQVGYNWQYGVFVGGLEGDLQWSGAQSSGSAICKAVTCTITASENIDAFATLRARAGVAFDAVYLYGTAGGAWTNASTSVNVSGSGASALNLSASKVGWTAGVGVEFALVDNWTAKVEYLYIDTGTISGTATVPASLGGGSLTETAAIRDNVFRIGVNYRFSFAPWPFTRY